MNLDKVTARFNRAYKRQKTADTSLKHSQKALFKEFDEARKGQTLAQQSVEVPLGQDVTRYIEVHYPGWVVVAHHTGTNHVIIKEDPSKLAYSYVNRELRMVFGRTSVTATPTLDDECLKREDPDLWERVSDWPPQYLQLARIAVKRLTAGECIWSQGAIDDLADEILRDADIQRVLMDPAKMDLMDLSKVQEYILPGKVSVRLVPPRQAREDELE